MKKLILSATILILMLPSIASAMIIPYELKNRAYAGVFEGYFSDPNVPTEVKGGIVGQITGIAFRFVLDDDYYIDSISFQTTLFPISGETRDISTQGVSMTIYDDSILNSPDPSRNPTPHRRSESLIHFFTLTEADSPFSINPVSGEKVFDNVTTEQWTFDWDRNVFLGDYWFAIEGPTRLGSRSINLVEFEGITLEGRILEGHEIPEPATMTLFGMGLVGGVLRKKRKNN